MRQPVFGDSAEDWDSDASEEVNNTNLLSFILTYYLNNHCNIFFIILALPCR